MDPIYGLAPLSSELLAGCKHSLFERLERVHQLGAIWLIPRFSALTHSRAEHSRGVAYLAGLFALRAAARRP